MHDEPPIAPLGPQWVYQDRVVVDLQVRVGRDLVVGLRGVEADRPADGGQGR
jgi:hypothetical protein